MAADAGLFVQMVGDTFFMFNHMAEKLEAWFWTGLLVVCNSILQKWTNCLQNIILIMATFRLEKSCLKMVEISFGGERSQEVFQEYVTKVKVKSTTLHMQKLSWFGLLWVCVG